MWLTDFVRKMTDILMPLEPVPEEEEVEKKVETKPVEVKAKEEVSVRRVATGGGGAVFATAPAQVTTSHSGTTYINGKRITAYKDTAAESRSNLKIVKPPELTMKIYNPVDYNQVIEITDEILNKNAVVVNYEEIAPEEQLRICDFIDGACYAVNGSVTKISDKIYLYVPEGVEASELVKLANSTLRHH